MKLFKAILVIILGAGIFMQANANSNLESNNIVMTLKDGDVLIELLPEIAPNHVNRIKELVSEGFYDGLKFHRVIEGFMAQTGDPSGTGTMGSGVKLKAEFSDEPHIRGTVSMARADDPDSADSQFFIVFEDAPHLDGQYTVFGRVIEGMEHVDNIKKGDPKQGGMVEVIGADGERIQADTIISMKLAGEIKTDTD